MNKQFFLYTIHFCSLNPVLTCETKIRNLSCTYSLKIRIIYVWQDNNNENKTKKLPITWYASNFNNKYL